MILTIFIDGFTYTGLLPFDLRISYFIYLFYLFYYIPISYANIKFKIKNVFNLLILFMFLFFSSAFNITYHNDTISLLFGQLIGISITSISMIVFLKINENKLEEIFILYLKWAVFFAWIGIFQELSYLLHFKLGYDFTRFIPQSTVAPMGSVLLRVNSLLREPAHFGAVLIPAFFVSVLSLYKRKYGFINKKQCVLIILSTILTFSGTTYIGILVSLVLIFVKKINSKITLRGLAIAMALCFLAYAYLPGIKLRVDDSVRVFGSFQKEEILHSNLSTFALASNAFITIQSLKNNFLIGSGLGSHELSYNKYFPNITTVDVRSIGLLQINAKDASSLFLRVLSETGIVGLIIIIIFLYKSYINRRKYDFNSMVIINHSILILFILRLLRNGHYFSDGLFFFVCLYYFSKKLFYSSLFFPKP